MRNLKLKYVHPIGRTSFCLHILKAFSVQIVLILSVLLTLKLMDLKYLAMNEWIHIGTISLFNFLSLWYLFDVHKYRARFKDIFPDQNLNLIFFVVVGFVPVLFVAFTLLLCFMKSDSERSPVIFKTRYALLGFVFLSVGQAMNNSFLYFTATPSTYNLVDTIHDTNMLLKYKKGMKYNPEFIAEYQKNHSSKLSVTELVLLYSYYLPKMNEEHDRHLASGMSGTERSLNRGIEILEINYKLLQIGEKSQLNFTDYSPVQWFYPAGPYEIFLLSMQENKSLYHFNGQIFDHSLNFLEKMDHRIEDGANETYSRQIASLRDRFQNTKTYSSFKGSQSP